MKTSTIAAFSVIFLMSSLCVFGQGIFDNPKDNRVIIKHYPGFQIDEMLNSDPSLMANINYYFTKSFDVELNGCPSCDVDFNALFNFELFDVSSFEGYRDANTPIPFQFKNGKYTITLLPENVVSNILGSNVESLLLKTFPKWQDGYTFDLYHNDVMNWAKFYPELYRTFTNSPSLLKIRSEEFLSLSNDKRNQVLNHPQGYLIIQ